MRAIVVTLLLAVAGTTPASQVDQWVKMLEHPSRRGAIRPGNFLHKYLIYDFSPLLIPRSTFLGYIGDDFQRLNITFKAVSRRPGHPDIYLVRGESRVGAHVKPFRGVITMTIIREYEGQDYGVDDEYLMAGNRMEGFLIGRYRFEEARDQLDNGTFGGVVSLYWFIDSKGHLRYDNIDNYSDGYRNNQYVGTWTRYRTGSQQTADWGEYRIPFSGDLDIGAGEFGPSPKYFDRGWDNYCPQDQ